MPSVLLDTCVWGSVRPELSNLGHDVNGSGDWERDPGDLAILEIAFAESRILVTLDKDFGELAILKGMPHAGIIRMHGFRTSQMAGVISILHFNFPLSKFLLFFLRFPLFFKSH